MTIVAVLNLLCACAIKLSAWINMPCLLVFLGVGILCGEQGIGHIKFDNPVDATIIGSIAMAFILFSGGFDTNWKNIKGICSTGGALSSVGVRLTALAVAFGSPLEAHSPSLACRNPTTCDSLKSNHSRILFFLIGFCCLYIIV